jgi:antitoxin VapB
MGLNIKNSEAEAAIRELAAHTGESLTDAIARAARERLARLKQEEEANRPARTLEEFRAWLKPIQKEVAQYRRRTGDTRTAREMVNDLYDENGLPK